MAKDSESTHAPSVTDVKRSALHRTIEEILHRDIGIQAMLGTLGTLRKTAQSVSSKGSWASPPQICSEQKKIDHMEEVLDFIVNHLKTIEDRLGSADKEKKDDRRE
ncbi:MAG: hypothetical protein HY326_00860 [Chloroflexi bacterium]|nr:hypothetical protein [Chloroflexota bacterium]